LKQGLRGVPNYHVQTEDNLNIIDLLVTSGMLFINKKCSQLTTLFIVLKYYYQSIDYTSSLFKV
ncbi:tyrosine--tRNA ligase, partial [Streptococcus agalactiae]